MNSNVETDWTSWWASQPSTYVARHRITWEVSSDLIGFHDDISNDHIEEHISEDVEYFVLGPGRLISTDVYLSFRCQACEDMGNWPTCVQRLAHHLPRVKGWPKSTTESPTQWCEDDYSDYSDSSSEHNAPTSLSEDSGEDRSRLNEFERQIALMNDAWPALLPVIAHASQVPALESTHSSSSSSSSTKAPYTPSSYSTLSSTPQTKTAKSLDPSEFTKVLDNLQQQRSRQRHQSLSSANEANTAYEAILTPGRYRYSDLNLENLENFEEFEEYDTSKSTLPAVETRKVQRLKTIILKRRNQDCTLAEFLDLVRGGLVDMDMNLTGLERLSTVLGR